MMRQIALDTETTGLSTADGHRVIEIGAVEMVDRLLTGKRFHVYLNPQRMIDQEAVAVHGLTQEFLADKPLFQSIAQEFVDFIQGAELVIHNAAFDLEFLNYELKLAGYQQQIENYCSIFDTLEYARKKHPGLRNNLDALCKRYHIDNSNRQFHGALLDAGLLAEVYLAMTGGQANLFAAAHFSADTATVALKPVASFQRLQPLRVIQASAEELAAHAARLRKIKEVSGHCHWLEGLGAEEIEK